MGVSQPHQVHHPLHRAILAGAAMQRIEHDIWLGFGQAQRDIAVHVDPRDRVPARFQCFGNAFAGHQAYGPL